MVAEAGCTLRGRALHCGQTTEVRLSRQDGPSVLVQGGIQAPFSALRLVRADRGVTLASESGGICVDLVEHLFAALGGLGIVSGLRVDVTGPELPLLDGGSAGWAKALASLELPTGTALQVARADTLHHGDAAYRFQPAGSVHVAVHVRFPRPVGRQAAVWAGDADDFRGRIAPARTFGWIKDLGALRAAGRAAAVDLTSVLVFDDDGPIEGCSPPRHAEPARHKLLDLIGDLAMHGGPPIGVVEAWRPGHAATHAVVARALATGVLVARRLS